MKGHLTEKEKKLIIELKEAGQTLTAISKHVERNRITVRKYLNSILNQLTDVNAVVTA